MHQHTIVGYIIGMIVLDLEVIDLDRAFEQLVLDFFDDNIFARTRISPARSSQASVQPLTGESNGCPGVATISSPFAQI